MQFARRRERISNFSVERCRNRHRKRAGCDFIAEKPITGVPPAEGGKINQTAANRETGLALRLLDALVAAFGGAK